MKITALAPWFGGKRNLAPTIVEELGDHSVYWEFCAGGFSVLLVKPPCTMETAVDLHGDLTNLARVVAHPTLAPRLYRQLRRTLMTDDFHKRAKGRLDDGPPVPVVDDPPSLDRAYWYFIASWLGRNGVAGTSSYKNGFCVRYTANGGHAAKRWQSAVTSIPAWRRRLANVTILRRDMFDILPRVDDVPRTAIYIDPPYFTKGAKYLHDFEPGDHHRLAELLGRFTKSRVVLSYYDHPLLAELFEEATQ